MLNSQCFVNAGLSKTLLKFIHLFLFTLLNVAIRKFKGTRVPCILFLLGNVALGHLLPLGFDGFSTHTSPPRVLSVGLWIIFTLGSRSCGAPNGSSWPLDQCLVTKKMAPGHQPS